MKMSSQFFLMISTKQKNYSSIDVRFEKEVPESEEMQSLISSVKSVGVKQPILVRSISNNKFEVVSGNRRLTAAKDAKLPSIPAVVEEMDDESHL